MVFLGHNYSSEGEKSNMSTAMEFRAYSKSQSRIFTQEILRESCSGLIKAAAKLRPDLPVSKGGLYLPIDDKDLTFMQYSGVEDGTDEQNRLFTDDVIRFEYEGEWIKARVHREGPGWLLVSDSFPDHYIYMNEVIEIQEHYFIRGSRLLGNIHENRHLREGVM